MCLSNILTIDRENAHPIIVNLTKYLGQGCLCVLGFILSFSSLVLGINVTQI